MWRVLLGQPYSSSQIGYEKLRQETNDVFYVFNLLNQVCVCWRT